MFGPVVCVMVMPGPIEAYHGQTLTDGIFGDQFLGSLNNKHVFHIAEEVGCRTDMTKRDQVFISSMTSCNFQLNLKYC